MSCIRFEAISHSQDNTSCQLVAEPDIFKVLSCTYYI